MSGSGLENTHRTIERVARQSYGRLVAYLSVQTHDLASAEDAPPSPIGHGTVCHKIPKLG